MKLILAAAISCFSGALIAAPQSAMSGESSIVDRNDGLALKLNIHPPTEESGNRSLLISIDLSNEGSDVWTWTGDRRHNVGNVPQLREIFSVTLRDQKGNECELTVEGVKQLRIPEDNNTNEGKAGGILDLDQSKGPDIPNLKQRKGISIMDLVIQSHKYPLKAGDSFHWQVDLLRCFTVQEGKYEITISPRWENVVFIGGKTIRTTGNPDVQIAGTRVTLPGQTPANKAQK